MGVWSLTWSRDVAKMEAIWLHVDCTFSWSSLGLHICCYAVVQWLYSPLSHCNYLYEHNSLLCHDTLCLRCNSISQQAVHNSVTFSLKKFSKHPTKLWLWYEHTSLLVVYTLQVCTLLKLWKFRSSTWLLHSSCIRPVYWHIYKGDTLYLTIKGQWSRCWHQLL